MKDGFFFIGLLVLLFVVWLASGGPSRPVSFSGPYLHPITQTGTTAQPYGDPSQFSSVNSTVSVGTNGVGISSGQKNVALSQDIAGVSGSDPRQEYIIVNVSRGAGAGISTAGWSVKSGATGATVPFPFGTETPRAGSVNASAPITLLPGDEAIITTGRSPVGLSFRENECTGYLEEHQDFHPPLSQNCPAPSDELAHYYSNAPDACAAYVRTIPYCSTEASGSANPSASCSQFVEQHLNYNGCVAAHEKDANFKGTVWRIFLGQGSDLFGTSHDTITLLDAQGKIIDSLSY